MQLYNVSNNGNLLVPFRKMQCNPHFAPAEAYNEPFPNEKSFYFFSEALENELSRWSHLAGGELT